MHRRYIMTAEYIDNTEERSIDADYQQGVVTAIIDHGSIVQVFITANGRTAPYAADGNMWRDGPSGNIGVDDSVVFTVTDWGGLATIEGEGWYDADEPFDEEDDE
jgi:hypothetical protein